MGVGIGLGCAEFPFSGAAAYWRWIDMCEAGGVDSIWQTDRIVGRQPFLESMTTMAALAGRTRRMRFGMNVVSLAFRDPVLLAKQCATIDVLSDGRLLPAFGIGSPLAPEWQALGMDTKTRGRKTDECLEIIRRLWREELVDFSGAFYKLKGVTIAPKPVQPDLPMWIGGSTDAAIRRTARIGTGWQAGGDPPAEAGRVVAAIKAAASRSRPIDRRRSLWRRLRVPLRQPGRARRRQGDGCLRQTHRTRRHACIRDRRRRHDPRARRRICRRWRVEVHFAAARRR